MSILQQVNEAIEDVGKSTLKKVMGHLANAGMSMDDVSKFFKNPKTDKWMKELTKDGKDPSSFVSTADQDVHKLILALYAKKAGMRDADDMANAIGMQPIEMINLVHNKVEELTKHWPGFKPNFFPEPKTKFVERFKAGERNETIKKHMEELANNKHGSVAAIDVAKFLIKKYNLSDDEESLRRSIDKVLESMPELDRYRPMKK